MSRACTIDECEAQAAGRGLCKKHWARWRTHGDPLVVKKAGIDYSIKGSCTHGTCARPLQAQGLCSMHYSRFRKHGDASIVLPIAGRPLNGEFPSFAAIHKRLHRAKGPARNYTCVDCGGQAAEWSYNQSDSNQVMGRARNSIVPYSLDIDNYDPRCVRCHRIFDKAGEGRVRNEKGQFVTVHAAKYYADDLPGVNVKVKALA